MATQRQMRRDTTANLGGVTPVVAEHIYDTDRGWIGAGDGVSVGSSRALFALMQRDLHKMAPIAATAGGTADALTVTLDPAPSAYVAFMTIVVKASANNTGPATINVNGLGARTIRKGGGGSDLEADDIVSGGMYLFIFDGTFWQMISGAGAGAGGGIVPIKRESITSSVASVTVTGLDSGFPTYLIVGRDIRLSGAARPRLRVGTSGGIVTSEDYRSGPWDGSNTNSVTLVDMAGFDHRSGAFGLSFWVWVYHAESASAATEVTGWTRGAVTTGGHWQRPFTGGIKEHILDAHDRVQFFLTANNYTAGEIELYGIEEGG